MSARATIPTKRFRLAELHRLRETEQVAAVCYRIRGEAIEFLLVRTRGNRWTFPKGGVEPGLTHAQSAALEAFEEAGVHGRMAETAFASYRRGGNGRKRASQPVIHAHLCEVVRLGPPQESGRERTWFSGEEAKQRLQKDRTAADGREMSRVVDRAVGQIEQFRRAAASSAIQAQLPSVQPSRDALQKVEFEAPMASGLRERLHALFSRFIHVQSDEPGQLPASVPRLSAGAAEDIPIEKVTPIDRDAPARSSPR